MAVRPPIVSSIRRAACLLAAVASLGSCQVGSFLFGSVFPAATVLVKAQVDLSAQIPSSSGDSFKIRIVAAGGYEYVMVIGSLTSGSVAYVYDSDLNYKKTLTGLGGSGAMVDATGDIALGSTLFSPDLATSSTLPNQLSVSSTGNTGIDGFVDVTSTTQIINFGFNSTNHSMSYDSCPSPWSSRTSLSATVSSSLSNLSIVAILDNGSTGTVTFVFSSSDSSQNATSYFFTANKAGFSVPLNVLDRSPSRNSLVDSSFGYANGSLFAYDTSSSSFVRINPSTGSIQNSFSSVTNNPSQTKFAYRVSGGSFYGFNTKSRVLTKYAAWW